MRIAIIGGHGKVAMLLSPLLTSSGHEVTSLIRNLDHAGEVATTGAVPVVADLEHLDVEAIAAHLTGHDAIVWTAGAGGGDPDRTYAVDRDAAMRSMDAAALAGVGRYVMVSYFGAGSEHGVPPDSSFFAYAEAKAAADAHLMASDLAWTILGPSTLTSESGTGMIEVGPEITAGHVPRSDVALVVAATLGDPATAGAVIPFNTGTVPIGAAIARFTHERGADR